MEKNEYRKPDLKKGLAVIGLMVLIVSVVGVVAYLHHSGGGFVILRLSDYLALNDPDSGEIHIYSNVYFMAVLSLHFTVLRVLTLLFSVVSFYCSRGSHFIVLSVHTLLFMVHSFPIRKAI